MTSKIVSPYLIHLLIGIFALSLPNGMYLFTLGIPVVGAIYVIRNQNKNHEALIVCCYIAGIEVLLRMTGTMFFNEYGKYTIMLFLLLGVFYRSFSFAAFAYVIIALLLSIGVFYGAFNLRYDVEVRKAIVFNISGPATLIMSAIYCYHKPITFDEIKRLIYTLSLPIFSILTFIIVKTPSIKDVVTGTQSNFATSGGFGPNQVSTVLGLGTFCTFILFLTLSKNKIQSLFFLFLTAIFAYRGIVTFSRGGMMTAGLMMVAFLIALYFKVNLQGKLKLKFVGILSFFLIFGVWSYSSLQTGGMIDKRYKNQDKIGRTKADALGGRETLAKTELQMFWENPIIGVGVGRNKEYREEMTGHVAASHNELTRLLAEHGSIGAFVIFLLILIPFIERFTNPYHLFFFPFIIFWFLTIQHAAMRTALPGFIYGLTLLKVLPFASEKSEI